VDDIIRSAITWDVMGGVARRAWARNPHSLETVAAFNEERNGSLITLPFVADSRILSDLVEKEWDKNKKT
jgi:urocanate hydratase